MTVGVLRLNRGIFLYVGNRLGNCVGNYVGLFVMGPTLLQFTVLDYNSPFLLLDTDIAEISICAFLAQSSYDAFPSTAKGGQP